MSTTKVQTCSATDCAFNEAKTCHAHAITVDQHSCGTYTPTSDKGGDSVQVANVGACKAADCKHNKDLICQAASVQVGMEDGKVSCLTYSAG